MTPENEKLSARQQIARCVEFNKAKQERFGVSLNSEAVAELHTAIEALSAENERLAEALGWIADKAGTTESDDEGEVRYHDRWCKEVATRTLAALSRHAARKERS